MTIESIVLRKEGEKHALKN